MIHIASAAAVSGVWAFRRGRRAIGSDSLGFFGTRRSAICIPSPFFPHRDDAYNQVYETFCDNAGANGSEALNRLSNYSVSGTRGNTCTTGTTVDSMSYDNDGDIAAKSDVGSYVYSGVNAGPHAVTSIATNPGVNVDGVANPYFVGACPPAALRADRGDANGNMLCVSSSTSCTTGAARSYQYTSFNPRLRGGRLWPDSVSQGSNTTTIAYDPEHLRGASTTSAGVTTWHFGNPAVGLWSEMLQGSTSTWHDYLMPYGEIAAEIFSSGGVATPYYFVGDHLASTTAITTAAPALQEYDSYDAWGQRRQSDGNEWSGCTQTPRPPLSLRGYTGEEQLYAYCLVNLNGRIYDPGIGRFLSPDPTVPDPTNGQSYGRYSYVVNNPLRFADPTGYGCGDETTSCYEIHYIDGDNEPCWDCSGPGITNDVYGNPVPATNFSGGWNTVSIGWNGTNGGFWRTTSVTVTDLDPTTGQPISNTSTAQVWVPGTSETATYSINSDTIQAGINASPQTYWVIGGAAIGQYFGKQVGPLARQMGLDNLRQWGEEQGMSSFEIEEMLAAAEGAEA